MISEAKNGILFVAKREGIDDDDRDKYSTIIASAGYAIGLFDSETKELVGCKGGFLHRNIAPLYNALANGDEIERVLDLESVTLLDYGRRETVDLAEFDAPKAVEVTYRTDDANGIRGVLNPFSKPQHIISLPKEVGGTQKVRALGYSLSPV